VSDFGKKTKEKIIKGAFSPTKTKKNKKNKKNKKTKKTFNHT